MTPFLPSSLAPSLAPLLNSMGVQDDDDVDEEHDTLAAAPRRKAATTHPRHYNPEVTTNETDDGASNILEQPNRNETHRSTETEDASRSRSNMGVHGVRLKHFERVVARLLTTTTNEKNADDYDDKVTAKEDCHADGEQAGGSSTTSEGGSRLRRPQYVQLPPMVEVVSAVVPNPDGREWPTPTTIDPNDDRILQPASWPWDSLPPAARVYGTLPGQLSHAVRASRKEDQIRSLLQCILPLILPTDPKNATTSSSSTSSDNRPQSSIFTIVDFGGGSGHLSIPLALLRPSCRIVCVDLGRQSLELLHQKAAHCFCCKDSSGGSDAAAAAAADGKRDIADERSASWSPAMTTSATTTQEEKVEYDNDARWRRTAIANLWTFHGPAQAYYSSRRHGSNVDHSHHPDYPLDMAVALHLCGEATDVVLRLAGERGAVSIVAAPCCVGKLQQKATPASSSSKKKIRGNRNPYIFQATGQNQPTVQYPQSRAFQKRLAQPCDWDALAKAADYSDATECRTARNAARRTAKALLEMDRCLFLQEYYNYETVLTRMQPWEASPKNDILVAWKRPSCTSNAAALDEPPPPPPSIFDCPVDLECQADIRLTMDHLMLPPTQVAVSDSVVIQNDTVDWTRDEMESMRRQLTEFLHRTRNDPTATMIFPTGMGGRQRKLVHYTAEQMNLAHWCQGFKHAEKTVAVRRKGDKPKLQQQQPTITTSATGDK